MGYPGKLTGIGIRNATAGRRLATAYNKQFGQPCEDCGERDASRRRRCKRCDLLVCGWCFHHVHSIPLGKFDPPACAAK